MFESGAAAAEAQLRSDRSTIINYTLLFPPAFGYVLRANVTSDDFDINW